MRALLNERAKLEEFTSVLARILGRSGGDGFCLNCQRTSASSACWMVYAWTYNNGWPISRRYFWPERRN